MLTVNQFLVFKTLHKPVTSYTWIIPSYEFSTLLASTQYPTPNICHPKVYSIHSDSAAAYVENKGSVFYIYIIFHNLICQGLSLLYHSSEWISYLEINLCTCLLLKTFLPLCRVLRNWYCGSNYLKDIWRKK